MRIVAVVALALLVAGPLRGGERQLKDPEGNVLGLLVDCSSCKQAGEGQKCDLGVADGFHNGADCGQCLLESNFGVGVSTHYDIKITGRLVNQEGQPVAGKFVQMRLPNTWGVKARTTDRGDFLIRLGATRPRKSSTPAALELGELKMKEGSEIYGLFLLPQNYKPCKGKDKDTKKD